MSEPVTLITGTSRGIGNFLSRYYLDKGHIVIGCSRSKSDIKSEYYEHYSLDVSNEIAVKKIISFIRKKYGRLDHLLNNAGIASMNHVLLTPTDTVHNIFNTNFLGTFLFCREASKLMIKNKYGRIVNFTTIATPLKLEGESIYSASKAAIKSFTEIIAREVAPYGITVNSVGPNPIETDLIRNVDSQKIDALLQRQVFSRKGAFEDVANVVDFYLMKSSSFITGQNIYLAGI